MTKQAKPHPPSHVLILRSCDDKGCGLGGFPYPDEGMVEAPAAWDSAWGPQPAQWRAGWIPDGECGGGLHGLLWASGDWSLTSNDLLGKWKVIKVAQGEWVSLGQKVKFWRGEVIHSGILATAITCLTTHELFKQLVAFEAAEKQASTQAVVDGNSSTAASSGNYSTAASSGYSSTAASSGNYSTAASSGNYSTAASSGYYSTAASSGNSSTAASSGNYSTAASSGNYSTAASSGYYSTAASSGNYSTAASSGYYSTAASSGNYSTAASSGYYSTAEQSGKSGIAAAVGVGCIVSAGELGCMVTFTWDGSRYRAVVGYVGEDGIEANMKYKAGSNGKLVKA